MLAGTKKSKLKLATKELSSLPKELRNPSRKLKALRHIQRTQELDVVDPRQELFLSYWLDPKSETFNQVYKSALRAGYSQSYAEKIRSANTEWMSNIVKDKELLAKAEANLDYFLVKTKNEKLKWNATEFVSETLGKQRFSKKTEQDININVERIERIEYVVPQPTANAQNNVIDVVPVKDEDSIIKDS